MTEQEWKAWKAKQGSATTSTEQPQPSVGVNGAVSPTNANPQLVTRGAGQFTSVDDYLDKTGQRAINYANTLATLDSQQRANNLDGAQNHYDLVGKYQEKTGEEPYGLGPNGLGPNYVSPQLAKTESYMFNNVQKDARETDEFNKLSEKMQNAGKLYAKTNPTEYNSASDAVKGYEDSILKIENDARAFASRFGAEGSQAYNAAYAMKTSQDEGYNQLVAAREAAMKDSEQEEEDKRIRELFGDDKTDIETLRVQYQAIMDAQKRDEQQRVNPAGSADTMDWDNSFNQNQTVNGQAVPTYDPVTNYNWFSGNDNDEINRLRREAQRKGLVWGSPEFEEYVRQHLDNG